MPNLSCSVLRLNEIYALTTISYKAATMTKCYRGDLIAKSTAAAGASWVWNLSIGYSTARQRIAPMPTRESCWSPSSSGACRDQAGRGGRWQRDGCGVSGAQELLPRPLLQRRGDRSEEIRDLTGQLGELARRDPPDETNLVADLPPFLVIVEAPVSQRPEQAPVQESRRQKCAGSNRDEQCLSGLSARIALEQHEQIRELHPAPRIGWRECQSCAKRIRGLLQPGCLSGAFGCLLERQFCQRRRAFGMGFPILDPAERKFPGRDQAEKLGIRDLLALIRPLDYGIAHRQ